ncbi:MAG: PEP-CTERM sorting domain-containing protein [Verrucomicrobiota bacterium JB022]|nr:PEP-CTERM sorting domain-containing protein [Verrucomicrobiota bacterium JB022]
MLKVSLLTGAALLALVSNAAAIVVIPESYSYSVAPSGSYPDTGGTELTDGVDITLAWGNGINMSGQTAPLVGWLNTDSSITFSFAEPQVFYSVTAFFADSDNAAGVGMPSTVTISDGADFSQTFNVTNPSGSGSTVATTFSGFYVLSDTLSVSFTRNSQWTMLSEVSFAAIPEPSTYAMGAGVAVLGLAFWRRRK